MATVEKKGAAWNRPTSTYSTTSSAVHPHDQYRINTVSEPLPSPPVAQNSSSSIPSFLSKVSWPQWAVGSSVTAAIIIIALEALIIVHVRRFLVDGFEKSADIVIVMVYFALFIIGMIFQAWLTYEASRHQNTMQAIAVACFNVACFVYSIIQVDEIKSLDYCLQSWMAAIPDGYQNDPKGRQKDIMAAYTNRIAMGSSSKKYCATTLPWGIQEKDSPAHPSDGTKIIDMNELIRHADRSNAHLHDALNVAFVILGLMAVMAAISCFLAYKVYRDYGWEIFQQQGASLVKKRLLRHVHLFVLFLKLNIYFSLGIILQVALAIALSHSISAHWIAPMILLIFVGVTYYLCGWYAIQHTNRGAMYCFFGLIAGNVVGVIYILIAASSGNDFAMHLQATHRWLVSFGAVQLVLNFATMWNAILCLNGFDQGLGEMVGRSKSQAKPMEMEEGMSKVEGRRPRLELD
ncbi:uncharacterized protein EV422DRAFT_541385 [Fimicolochytrium jonesii]|uniref:uncharacterized protein n=1 Tax=Fimicolochytrium jonesii TaxID=1396493 RepID=UPI0022FECFE0|nr:uncharacterized protein EV422DRAFT_541385 [Fimicolochytrium jonesii]KAI8817615.1 hypothetical protein EV422DRAFT_541385 [Fimicolochytrium jonesii]